MSGGVLSGEQEEDEEWTSALCVSAIVKVRLFCSLFWQFTKLHVR